MVGGCLRCLSCFVTCSFALLVGVCVHGVEASSCQRIIHKKVGDSVELPSCLPTEGVTVATWKYGPLRIADKDRNIADKHQFTDRLHLNRTTFSLTVRGLTLQDSGDYSFSSEANNKQRETVIIKLQVHEPITTMPVLNGSSPWHTLNESCTVWLECSATSDSSYNWTVRNQTISGSRLQYILKVQDGDTKFTCTAYNMVSQMSESKTVKCSNNTDLNTKGKGIPQTGLDFLFILGMAAGGCALFVIVLGIVVGVCHSKRNRAGSHANDITVYADISEVAIGDGASSTMKPCSVYETIDNRVNTVTPGPQTVYDKIQLSRVRKASVSPYQEIS